MMKQKMSFVYASLVAVMVSLLLVACGDSATAVPAATTAAATTAAATTAATTTTVAATTAATTTTVAATTAAATTVAATTAAATTAAVTTAAVTTAAATTVAATTAAATTVAATTASATTAATTTAAATTAAATTAAAGATTAAAAAGTPITVGAVVTFKSKSEALGYLDTRGYVKDEAHFSGNTGALALVQTSKDSNRDKGSGTWKIESATGKANGTPIKNGEKVYLKNCFQQPNGYLMTGNNLSADDLKLLSGLRSGVTGGAYIFTSVDAKTSNPTSLEFLIVTAQGEDSVTTATAVAIGSPPGTNKPSKVLEAFDWQKIKGLLANAGTYGPEQVGFVFGVDFTADVTDSSRWTIAPSTTPCA